MSRSCLLAVLLVALVGSCAASWMQFKSLPTDGSQPETVTGLLRLPHGGGRAPAVILLADCDGVGAHERRWGRELTEAGYVSYVIDGHFTRQVDDGCASPLSHEVRIADALGALAKLAEHDRVDGDRIAIMGWGLGGDAALDIVSSTELLPGTSGVRGVIAFYPTCQHAGPVRQPAILVLPELYPAESRCRAYAQTQVAGGEAPVRFIAPGGVEAGFDCQFCAEGYLGGEVTYDRAAADLVHGQIIEALQGFLAAGSLP